MDLGLPHNVYVSEKRAKGYPHVNEAGPIFSVLQRKNEKKLVRYFF